MALEGQTVWVGATTREDASLAMLKLMADPVALGARIKEYEDAKAAAEAKIALVGPADQIMEFHAQARAMRQEATEAANKAGQDAAALRAQAEAELEKAQATAGNLLAATKAQVEAMTSDAIRTHDVARSVIANADAYAAKTKADADAVASTADATMQQAKTALASAAMSQRAADAARTKYEAKLKKLQAAASDDSV